MLRCCYTALMTLIQPFLLLVMWKRSLKLPDYRRRLGERYGIYSRLAAPLPGGMVIHAASVGEVIAATPLIRALQARYPHLALTVTTVTPTGSARVKAAFGEQVTHVYLPYDLPFAVRRFLHFIQPRLFVVIETELWPNLIREIRQQQIPFVIANARLSPRSATRYGWIQPQVRHMLNEISLILAQDSISAERYLGLGFPSERLVNTGNLKFDITITAEKRAEVDRVAAQLGIAHRPVWIAGSTHEGEEKWVLDAHRQLREQHPDLLLILVPRHPERFDAVAQLIKKSGLSYVRRTEHSPLGADISVLLGDTMGEMMLLYGLAQIAFVGGSLVKHGGHNPLEPIAFDIPVISGMFTFNFPEIFAKLREVNGVIEVASSAEALGEAVDYLLTQPNQGRAISQAGFSVLHENQGALERHVALLARYLDSAKETTP